MGFFDRFTGKKPAAPATPSNGTSPSNPPPAAPSPSPAPDSAAASPSAAPFAAPAAAGGPISVKQKLAAAREKLDLKDLSGALAIYEELVAAAGDRADVLVSISGDLGSHGHVAEIIELVAPRYDADRHGPATGLNLLQAYLAVRNPDAAQHVLDILFALNRPELEDRLHGFANAIAEMLHSPMAVAAAPGGGAPGGATTPQIALISISKPIWFYGLEPLAAQILPPKGDRLRRIAFAQLALPTQGGSLDAMKQPEDELGRLSRAIPLWFTETFYFSPNTAPITAIGVMHQPDGAPSHHVIFGSEWTTENLRQLVDTSGDPIDFVLTGALRMASGDYELVLRLWEVKNFRERKTFTARWTPATAESALTALHGQLRTFMEWSPNSATFAYTIPAQPLGWLDTLGASLGLFLADKKILPPTALAPVGPDLARAAQRAAGSEAASLAFLTLRDRAARLGLPDATVDATLSRSTLVTAAQKTLSA